MKLTMQQMEVNTYIQDNKTNNIYIKGSPGGGKTTFGIMKSIALCTVHPGIKVLIIGRVEAKLRPYWVKVCYMLGIHPEHWEFVGDRIVWLNESEILFIEEPKDIKGLKGERFNFLFVDQYAKEFDLSKIKVVESVETKLAPKRLITIEAKDTPELKDNEVLVTLEPKGNPYL